MLAYLLSSTELKQLLKIPFLIEHFIEHKSQKNDLSLMAFFALHYGSEHSKDTDDLKLPFKSHEGCENGVSTILAPIFHLETAFVSYFYESTIVYLKEDQISSSSYLSAIWQPPKSC